MKKMSVFFKSHIQKNRIALCFLMLSGFSVRLFAQISGVVYFDGNNDGVKGASESGYGGITVTAYNTTGTSAGSAVSATNGAYSIPVSAGNYRIEFTLPNTGLYAAAVGTGSNSSIQFAANGATNVNFGVYQGSNYIATADPRLVISNGLDTWWDLTTPSVSSWKYSDRLPLPTVSSSSLSPHTDDYLANQVGVLNGITARLSDKMIFASTITTIQGSAKPYPPSPDGSDVIYMFDYSGPGFTKIGFKKLVNLSTYVNIANQSPAVSGTTTDYYGEKGLGGVELSSDGNTLYVVNMGNGKLIKIDISGVNYASLPATAPAAAQISEISIPSALPNPTNGVFRPNALQRRGNALYVGGINDASTGTDADLQGVVLRYDLNTLTWSKVFTFEPELFKGGALGGSPNTSISQTKWQAHGSNKIQPYFSDIAFDDTDSMILGIGDREVLLPSTNLQAGYVIRTCRDVAGNFTLENNGNCTPFTSTARPAMLGGGTASPSDGPGGNYFFEQSMFSHAYVFSGGLFIKSGTGELFGGAGDPVDYSSFGARIWDWKNGQTVGGVHTGGTKVANMVGMEGVGEPAPIEIGNRVWLDTDNDGVQDAGEAGISGVQVQLLKGTTVLATATTDTNGNYIFSSGTGTDTASFKYGLTQLMPNMAYTVRFPATATVTATTYNLTTANAGTDNLIDSDAPISGDTPVLAVDIPVYGANNHSFDAGYSAPLVVCTINTPTVVATCNNNGTPAITTDDTFTFTISATGTGVGANYKVDKTAPAPTSTPFASVNYGTTSASSAAFPISGGNLTLTLTDNTTATCTLANVNVPAPAPCSTPPAGQPDLELVKTADKVSVVSGNTLVYTLTLRNIGTASATGVQIRDLLPAGLTYVSSVPSQGTYTVGTGIWNVGTVAQGATLTLTITVTVN